MIIIKENYIGRAEVVIGDFASPSGTYNSSWDNSFWALRSLLKKYVA
jgi:hypothetical protein